MSLAHKGCGLMFMEMGDLSSPVCWHHIMTISIAGLSSLIRMYGRIYACTNVRTNLRLYECMDESTLIRIYAYTNVRTNLRGKISRQSEKLKKQKTKTKQNLRMQGRMYGCTNVQSGVLKGTPGKEVPLASDICRPHPPSGFAAGHNGRRETVPFPKMSSKGRTELKICVSEAK